MYPGCRFMDLNPRERDQMSYATHHGPAFGHGHVMPHMKMETGRPVVNHEPFPWYGIYGCPYPLPYQGCYHNQVPNNYNGYGLHYPHYAPPPPVPPVYCHGSYPPLPGSYPFQHLPSPPFSGVDPRYEYDKKASGDHHCCGCPNHMCQQNENKNVKIEEQITDEEKDKDASLVPYELKDQSYPVLWIPPGYKRSKEDEQTSKQESKRESSSDKEANGSLKPCAQEPGVWNGWLPINLNNLNSLVQGRDEKGTEHKQNEDGHSEQKDKLELKDEDTKSIWDPSQYRIFPLKFIGNQDNKSMPEGDTENCDNSSPEDGPKGKDTNFVKKIIPVKQIDRSEDKGLPKDGRTEENRAQKAEKSQGEMPLKHADKKGEKKHLENHSHVQSSLSKASKLPPICLRVDPFPSRRSKGGSSRSPSPPANKKKSEMMSHDKSSSSTMQENKKQESSADSNIGRLQSGKKAKDIEVVDSTMRDNKIEAQKEDLSQSPVNASAGDSLENVSNGCQDGKGVMSDLSAADEVVDKLSGEITKDDNLTIESQSGNVKCETGTNDGSTDTNESGLANTDLALNQKFSEAEAAVIIQSVYRGFQVRRWEPLKKLKEIARIEGELVKLRMDVQNLVSSGNGKIDKQKIVIGETIMNLLLQLDTMQGLHPSIRNMRKSVAKELVSLQEKLDSITFQNPEELKESDVSEHAEESSEGASEEGRQQDGEERHDQDTTSPSHMISGVTEPCQDQSHTLVSRGASEEERKQAGEDGHEQDTTSPSHMKSGVMELCQDQSHTLVGAAVDSEESELLAGTNEMGRASEEKQPDSSANVDLNQRHLEPLVEVKEPSEVHGFHEDCYSVLFESKELPPSIIEEEKLNPVAHLQDLSSLVDSDWSSKEDEAAKVNTEVYPPEWNSNAQVSGEGLQIDGGRCMAEPGEPELVQESGLIPLGNKARETSAEEQEHTKLLAESLKLSAPEDNIATEACSEGSSELKDNVGAEGDSERDREHSGDDMLGMEFVEASNEKQVNNIEGEANVCVVGEDDKSVDDVLTAAAGVDTKEISDLREVTNACELEEEGDDKPVDDMKKADSVEVEGEYKLVDDRQTEDTVGLEHTKTPEVNELQKDVGPVEDTESTQTWGPELDLTMATSDIQVKQQKPSYEYDTASGNEVHMEESANCNSEQKMAADEDQEMWVDKFDNKEICQKPGNGNITELHRDEDLLEEEFTGKDNKQPHGEAKFSTEDGNSAGEEIFAEEPRKVPASSPDIGQILSATGKESEKELVEENEKLKEAVEKLIAAGKEQLTAISSLSERVKDLEKKLSRKKKLKMRRHKSPSRYLLQV